MTAIKLHLICNYENTVRLDLYLKLQGENFS